MCMIKAIFDRQMRVTLFFFGKSQNIAKHFPFIIKVNIREIPQDYYRDIHSIELGDNFKIQCIANYNIHRNGFTMGQTEGTRLGDYNSIHKF